MWYVRSEANPSGAYPSPQSNKFVGSLELTDEQLEIFIEYNGFVLLTVEDDIVTEITPNTELWEEWKASLPEEVEVEPEPTDTEVLNTLLGV